MNTAVIILAAGIFYGISLLASLGRLTARSNRIVFIFALCGFALQTIWLGLRMSALSSLPVATPYDMLETLVWFLVLFPILGYLFFNVKIAGVFSMLPATLMTLLPFGCPLFLEKLSESPSRETVSFAATHGLLAAVSYAFTFFAATLAAMYLYQKKLLVEKRLTSFGRAIPSLGALERGMSACVSAAAASMLVSVAAGFVSASSVSATSPMILKFSLGLGLLIAQIALCALSAAGWAKGSKLAYLSIGTAIFALTILFPVAIVSWL